MSTGPTCTICAKPLADQAHACTGCANDAAADLEAVPSLAVVHHLQPTRKINLSRRRTERDSEPYWMHSDADESATAPVATIAAKPRPRSLQHRLAPRKSSAEAEKACAAREERKPDPKLVSHLVPIILGEPIWFRTCADLIKIALRRLPELAAYVGERRDGRLNTASDAEQTPLLPRRTITVRLAGMGHRRRGDHVGRHHAPRVRPEAPADHEANTGRR